MSQYTLGKDIILQKPLDKWVIEAGGSTARVFQATLSNFSEPVALKIMTPAWIQYSLPRFLEEIRIMCQIKDVKWTTHPIEFGFIRLDSIPSVDRKSDTWNLAEPEKLQGTIRRFVQPTSERFSLTQPEVQEFIKQLKSYLKIIDDFFEKNKIGKDSDLSDANWLKAFELIDNSLPYIAYETRDTIFLEPNPNRERGLAFRNWQKASNPTRHEINLLLICDEEYVVNDNLLPVNQGLAAAIQICDVLTDAHERNVTFVDHKIIHYYWNNFFNHVFIIDWNMGQYYPSGLPKEEIKFDVMQFSARALFHIFTGHQAKGALAVGRTEFSQLDQARRTHEIYQAGWKDGETKRLGPDLAKVLEFGLNPGFDNPLQLKKELQGILGKV